MRASVTITDSRMRDCVNYRVETGANEAQSRQKGSEIDTVRHRD